MIEIKSKIYVDNAATTKICDEALNKMISICENVGNPSSIHDLGVLAANELENSRKIIAKCMGCSPKNIFFTSGGTESDNQAILSAAIEGKKAGKTHIVSTEIEHHAVLNVLKELERNGFSVTLIKPDRNGIVDPMDVDKSIRDDTCLVSVMFANNEIGAINPIKEIGEICKKHSVCFHTDAVQAVGHVDIDLRGMNIDMLSASSHKFNGPSGVGFLYCRNSKKLHSIIHGGGQEFGKRAGTENLAGICGMAVALSRSCELMEEECKRIRNIRDKLIFKLSKIEDGILVGDVKNRLPGNVSFCFKGIDSESLVYLLSKNGIFCSQGSACSSGSIEPSHVLKSIGISKEYINGCIRITIGRYNDVNEVDTIYEEINKSVCELRRIIGYGSKFRTN